MGSKIYTGRYTTENEDGVVVFLIGMRINQPFAIHKWGPVLTAMPKMIKELYMNQEELGFLSMENYFGLRTTLMIQYWRSVEDLLAYAKGKKHLTAWKNFNQKVGNTKSVGIYHETYDMKNGNYESLYGNMPLYGLGKAMHHTPVTKERITARRRMDQSVGASYK